MGQTVGRSCCKTIAKRLHPSRERRRNAGDEASRRQGGQLRVDRNPAAVERDFQTALLIELQQPRVASRWFSRCGACGDLLANTSSGRDPGSTSSAWHDVGVRDLIDPGESKPDTTPPRGAPPELRHYGVPAPAVWGSRGICLVVALIVVYWVTRSQSTLAAVLVAAGGAVFVGLFTLAGEKLLHRAGLYETPDGLRIVNTWGSSVVPWDDIGQFQRGAASPTSRVFVQRTDGRLTLIYATAQRTRIPWENGETRDIVGGLNDRLNFWR
jgi:hypothetical protein